MRALALLTLLAGAPALADEPPENLPEPAIRKVLDLVYTVEDVSGKIEDLRIVENDLEIRLELAADVLFAFDKADLGKDAVPVLEKAAAFLRERRGAGSVRVEGHTDSKGDERYNQGLSERRARTVQTWLAKKGGLAGAKFEVKGLGETKPVVANEKPDGSDDEKGRQRNRRVEIVVRKAG